MFWMMTFRQFLLQEPSGLLAFARMALESDVVSPGAAREGLQVADDEPPLDQVDNAPAPQVG